MRLVLGIVLCGSGPTVGELALRLFRFGERCAEVAAAVGFGDEQIVCAVKDERRGVEAGVACLPERLPVVGRIETLIGIVGVVASFVAEERAGGDGLHVGEADAACLVGEDGAGVAGLRKEIAEGKAVVVEAEMHFELPRAFSYDETERVVMVAQLAAFAHGQAVVVVHRIVLRLQQLQPFGEVGRREFQSERRLRDDGPLVARDAIGQPAVCRHGDDGLQPTVGRGDLVVVGPQGNGAHQDGTKPEKTCTHSRVKEWFVLQRYEKS